MTGKSFVISHGFHFIQFAIEEVVGVDEQAPGPTAIGCSRLIVRA